jgi:hypothetical protein
MPAAHRAKASQLGALSVGMQIGEFDPGLLYAVQARGDLLPLR